MKPTLLILAAGIGSRYGGVKQMDEIGPSGESIIDYSIFDAIRAGFGKVVFVLNPKIEKDFKDIYEPRLNGKIKTDYVLQEVSAVPDGVKINSERIKPWGTGHAVLVANNVINEPFAVINADDFYGKNAFELISSFMQEQDNKSSEYGMVGYRLSNTLSENGSVSRGVCQTNKGYLTDVVERTSIVNEGDKIVYEENGTKHDINANAVVSMNFWGFSPLFFDQLEKDFRIFIANNAHNIKAEFYIPSVVNDLIKKNEASITMLTSNDQWFGVTYKDDKETTIKRVKALVESGVYPNNLWS
ncbi:MAG: nucleotidyltransferase [Lentimicrobiaceae bacterium]|jgi:UTP-glucose-1-phosphate uridylyltransferase|nr:nucleotidyltransferase [Lentimicrobiaceae bacterium]MCP4911250.1 nucleotidyltransferase [Bacteroidota bacterium]MBT3453960.1 nucleotidyltransferase [Lentimicrobiaceae bacterium]MBT3818571.1 nucleotidyltransferase [Lentimicrobiaceae bacterium]MBT4061933.1 nucleotidyltransferase [Lentimicrobiaceae bacterium]